MKNYNESDLELIIEKKIDECEDLPNVCNMIKKEIGRKRVVDRVKQIIFDDGITDIETALGIIETEMQFSEEDQDF